MLNEATIRIVVVTATVIGVPVLLAIALHHWISSLRSELPHWRNALGMTALLFAVSGWFWYLLTLKGVATDPAAQTLPLALWSLETSVGILLAPVLSIAWKRTPRYYLLAATVLLILGGKAFYYV